jgi:hypothetical protein
MIDQPHYKPGDLLKYQWASSYDLDQSVYYGVVTEVGKRVEDEGYRYSLMILSDPVDTTWLTDVDLRMVGQPRCALGFVEKLG